MRYLGTVISQDDAFTTSSYESILK